MYLNRANSTFTARQVPRLIKSKEDDLFPLPLRLLANYFPQQTLDLLNHVHGELQRCGHGENRDVCVKTLHDGWLLGKKSHTTQRELYAFFDTKVPSVADLSGASSCTHFLNLLVDKRVILIGCGHRCAGRVAGRPVWRCVLLSRVGYTVLCVNRVCQNRLNSKTRVYGRRTQEEARNI